MDYINNLVDPEKDAAGKADVLNRHARQRSLHISKPTNDYHHQEWRGSPTAEGETKKGSCPDLIPALFLHGMAEPLCSVLHLPSSSSSHLTQEQYPTIGELLTWYQSSKYVTVDWPQITIRYPSQP